MSKKLSTLSAGNLVKLNENGVAKKYIFLGHNHYGKGECVLLRKDTFSTHAYKASASSNYSASYSGSDLDEFCNGYHISTLDKVIQACLIDVPIPTVVGYMLDGTVNSSVETMMRKGFSLSVTEVFGTNGIAAEGTAFTYLSGTQANRIAYYDGTSKAVNWWLRSPVSSSGGYSAYYVDSSGASNSDYVCSADYGCPRPALALSSEILVSNGTDSDGCYTIDDAAIAGEMYQKVNGVWRRMC